MRGGPLSVGSDPAVLVKPDAKADGRLQVLRRRLGRVPDLRQHDQGQLRDRPEEDLRRTPPGALTRRMAYELALTTFHYVPEVQNVAVLLPVVHKGQKARMLVLDARGQQGSEVARGRPRPDRSAGKPDNRNEATKIAKVTDPLIFHYEVTATSDNQPVYLITPLLIKDTAAWRRAAEEAVAASLDGAARLELIAVARVAAQVRERHAQRPVLHLPDVAQLVRDEVAVVERARARTKITRCVA